MDLNAFKMCKGLRALGYAVVVLVAAIVALSYYAIVVLAWGPRLLRHASPLALLVLVLFHLLLVMIGWCYVRVVVTDPGGVPEGWRPDGDEVASLEDGSNLERRPRADNCRHCNNWKPPRSHHCSVFLNLAFVLSLLCFIVMHASLVLSNTTSIEVHEKRGAVRWRYDLGRKKNVEQVLGTKKAFWFIPMFSKEDLENTPALRGLDFPMQSDVDVQHS